MHQVPIDPHRVMDLALELSRFIADYGTKHPEMITQEALAAAMRAMGYVVASCEGRSDREDLIANIERILPAVLARALARLDPDNAPAAQHR